MSWSVYLTGTPDAVAAALDKDFERYGEGPSKEEFRAALPSLKSLIALNYGDGIQIIKLQAGGHAHSVQGSERGYSKCYVTIERIDGILS